VPAHPDSGELAEVRALRNSYWWYGTLGRGNTL